MLEFLELQQSEGSALDEKGHSLREWAREHQGCEPHQSAGYPWSEESQVVGTASYVT
jgi:hypothetical protein